MCDKKVYVGATVELPYRALTLCGCRLQHKYYTVIAISEETNSIQVKHLVADDEHIIAPQQVLFVYPF